MRIAVVGCGSAGMRHLRVLSDYTGVEVVAIPARTDRRDELARMGFETAMGIEAAGRLDGAVIATDTGRHVADMAAAGCAGVNWLLVEKPIACNFDEIQPLIQAAPDLAATTFVGYDLRFAPSLGAFRSALAKLGRIYAVDIQCRSYLPAWRPGRDYRQTYAARKSEGGVLRDLSHEIDYATWIFGQPNGSGLNARLMRTGLLDIDEVDTASLWWTSGNGTQMSIGLDYLARKSLRTMTAFGDNGCVTWDAIRQRVETNVAGKRRMVDCDRVDTLRYSVDQAREFISTIEGNTSSRLATMQDAMRTVAICDAAYRSQEAGSWQIPSR